MSWNLGTENECGLIRFALIIHNFFCQNLPNFNYFMEENSQNKTDDFVKSEK